MPIEFDLSTHIVGFAGVDSPGGERIPIIYRELLTPTDPLLLERLEKFQRSLFSSIPGLPPVSQIDHLLLVIHPDLRAVAYVDELNITAEVRPNRPIEKGEAVRVADVEEISSIDLGVTIPGDAGFVLVRSFGWRRSLFYDLGPLQNEPVERDYSLERALAEQALVLLGLSRISGESAITRLEQMKAGLESFDALIAERNSDESLYQELLEANPWMLGGVYDQIIRHRKLDDERIPDFTGRRSSDLHHDVIEIKPPFEPLFKQSGDLNSFFNDAWNQTENYLRFVQRQRAYLRDEKGLAFENAQALLIAGWDLQEDERKRIREKESLNVGMSVRTYDEVRRVAGHILNLVETASERTVPENSIARERGSRAQSAQ